MSRASFVSEGSVAWLTPSSRQTKHSYHRVQTCDTRSHSSFVSVAPGQRNVICRRPQRHKGFGCNSTTYLLTYRCKRLFAIVIVFPAARRAVRHHQVQEALTPTYLGCVQQRHNWVLTPTYFIVFNDNAVHCISVYN